MTTQQPWYDFSRIDNFGQIDPQGDYYKPDSNILTPYGYPVTSLLSGTVTSVQRTGYGQSVVTIKLDEPLNNLATHMFYEHMHNATVFTGQHVASGTQIGTANDQGEGANLGVGLYSGDVYGSGDAWSILQKDLAPGGAGLLNPTTLLNSAKDGVIGNGVYSPLTSTVSSTTSGGSLLDFGNIGVKIGIFLLAVAAVIGGLYVLFQHQVDSAVVTGTKTAAKAALA